MHCNNFKSEFLENTSIILERIWPIAARLIFGALVFAAGTAAHASDAEDKRILADLDTKYQKAVQQNDAKIMAQILADGFILVEGDGKRSTKADLLNDAKSAKPTTRDRMTASGLSRYPATRP